MYYYYQIIIKKSEHRCAICRAKERKKERKNERKEGLRASGNVELGAWCTRERSERTMENDRNRASGLFTRGNVVIIFALSCLWPRRLAQVHPPRNHSRKKRSPGFQPIRNRASPVYLEFIRSYQQPYTRSKFRGYTRIVSLPIDTATICSFSISNARDFWFHFTFTFKRWKFVDILHDLLLQFEGKRRNNYITRFLLKDVFSVSRFHHDLLRIEVLSLFIYLFFLLPFSTFCMIFHSRFVLFSLERLDEKFKRL